ncbi:hypothetical protein Tco_0819808 [Tanacetum coccineum]|uniref:Uncharacterized protein n=1 Tax=Tanacetum coccineum TaxID=301880 RepID=A0ABQ5A9C5_9ASTR
MAKRDNFSSGGGDDEGSAASNSVMPAFRRLVIVDRNYNPQKPLYSQSFGTDQRSTLEGRSGKLGAPPPPPRPPHPLNSHQQTCHHQMTPLIKNESHPSAGWSADPPQGSSLSLTFRLPDRSQTM